MAKLDLSTAPIAIQKLPRDERGYPIPASQYQPESGPDFRVLDRDRLRKLLDEQRCGVCGEPLWYWLWFIGGPACWPNRTFTDPPMHEACARFAAEVCPFIAGAHTLYSTKPLPEKDDPDRVFLAEPEMAEHVRRPEIMYLFKTRGYRVVGRGPQMYLKAARYAEVWKVGGDRVDTQEGAPA